MRSLEAQGWVFLFSTEEEDGRVALTMRAPEQELSGEGVAGILSSIEIELPEIDWEAQWAAFAPGYADGQVQLAVGDGNILLCPGPGFGDCSHPTTQLMLEALPGRLEAKRVLDVGTGSGVLAIAAASLGALKVLGTDIDVRALSHALENIALNPSSAGIDIQDASMALPSGEWDVLLLNMISSEQELAWAQLAPQLNLVPTIILSGIRREEELALCALWRSRGYHLSQSSFKDGWSCLILDYIHKVF